MLALDATLTALLELPAELSVKARAVPGLPDRLLRFIRMEMAMHERRQQRYSPEALVVCNGRGHWLRSGKPRERIALRRRGRLSGTSPGSPNMASHWPHPVFDETVPRLSLPIP